MRYSSSFTKTLREAPHDEESINAKLLIRGGYIDKTMAGVYSFLPLGLRVLKKIENIIREEMISVDGQEILLPTLQPKANWDKSGRWEIYDALFRFTSYYSKIDYVLGPTHEEIISPLAKKSIVSYKDLPKKVFQIQNKFRDEKRAKSGLLRGREFIMKDLYSFHKDEKDLEEYYNLVLEAYKRIFQRVGLDNDTYLTYASGGTFSKYSHEFQTLTDAGEDIIYVCDKCRIAVNREIIEDQNNACPQCGSKELQEKKAIEVGNIFKLVTKFSKPFELKYLDEQGQSQDVVMGCYGIGLQRLMGTIVEVHNDEAGIIWPNSVAPYDVHLVLLNSEKDDVKNRAENLYKKMNDLKIDVLFDDRADVSVGEKLKDSDLIGIPIRAIISEKNGEKVELKVRSENDSQLLDENEFIEKVSKKY